ncbi:MAG TPA: hypothetical protein VK907_08835, partial [Phnomibacter sp.]|nr:hypothetical protein [Phnomibacter sp.]
VPSNLFGGSAAITIDTNRNVGIGGEFPSNFNTRLFVSKVSSTDGPQVTVYESQTNNYARVELRSAQTNNPVRFWHVAGLNVSGAVSGDRLNLWHSTTGDIISIAGDNRVAIGAPPKFAAGYMLSVRGKIMCEELRVQLNAAWPDYVFEPGYNRPTLDQLESKVMLTKHLPGIPSAKEMEQNNGIEVGDMQKRLLEKLEELYLYVFELNKENKELKQRLDRLESPMRK